MNANRQKLIALADKAISKGGPGYSEAGGHWCAWCGNAIPDQYDIEVRIKEHLEKGIPFVNSATEHDKDCPWRAMLELSARIRKMRSW